MSNSRLLVTGYQSNLLTFLQQRGLLQGQTQSELLGCAADLLRRHDELIRHIFPGEHKPQAVYEFSRIIFAGVKADEIPASFRAIAKNMDYSNESLNRYFDALADLMVQGAETMTSSPPDLREHVTRLLAEAHEEIQAWDRAKQLTNVVVLVARHGDIEGGRKILDEALTAVSEIQQAEGSVETLIEILQRLLEARLGNLFEEVFKKGLVLSRKLDQSKRAIVYERLSLALARMGLGERFVTLIQGIMKEAKDIQSGWDTQKIFRAFTIAIEDAQLGESELDAYTSLVSSVPFIRDEPTRSEVIESVIEGLVKSELGAKKRQLLFELSQAASAIQNRQAREKAIAAIRRWTAKA